MSIVSHKLDNGMIVVVMSPRDATMIHDQILEPDTFPWMHSESQHTAHRFRSALMAQILEGTGELLAAIGMLPETPEQQPEHDEDES